ncbi:hypothetical protein H4R33_007256, partial [Dimargaris cristalligena]
MLSSKRFTKFFTKANPIHALKKLGNKLRPSTSRQPTTPPPNPTPVAAGLGSSQPIAAMCWEDITLDAISVTDESSDIASDNSATTNTSTAATDATTAAVVVWSDSCPVAPTLTTPLSNPTSAAAGLGSTQPIAAMSWEHINLDVISVPDESSDAASDTTATAAVVWSRSSPVAPTPDPPKRSTGSQAPSNRFSGAWNQLVTKVRSAATHVVATYDTPVETEPLPPLSSWTGNPAPLP